MKMNKKIIVAFIFLSLVFTTCIDEHLLPNFGHVSITSDPVGAAIYKNGENTGKITPANFDELLSGSYNFSLLLGNFIDTSFSVQLNEGQEYSQDIFLTETTPLGKIVLTSIPSGAAIFSEGIDTEKKTPSTFDKLQRGNYKFTLKLNLYEDHNVNINLTQNEIVERNTKLVIAGTAGSIFITSDPVGAEIILDGITTSLVTPDTLSPLAPGEHSILLSLENYRDTTIVSNVLSGKIITEQVDLTFYEPRGSITLSSNPQGAAILLNDNSTELFTPAKIKKLAAGEYKIKLSLEDYYDSTFSVTVIEDENTTAPIVNLIEIPFMITLSSNPSEGGSTSGGGGYNHGDEVSIVATSNTGYNFINWTENGNEVSSNSTYTFSANKDRDLVANFSLINYTISATSNPFMASNISGVGDYKHGDEVSLRTIANPGYQFTKWTENGSQVSTDTMYNFTATSNRNLIANYNVVGNLIVNSDPIEAEIYLNNEFTGFETPHSFENILTGQYNLTLKLTDFADTTQTILVNRNQTTDVGAIFMQDIVPTVIVNLTYQKDGGGIVFSFSFNQDVFLDKVDFTKPDETIPITQNYGGQSVSEGRVIDLPYPARTKGIWKFNFFGNKVGGRKAAFETIDKLVVE